MSKPLPCTTLLPQCGYYYPVTSNPIQVQLTRQNQIENVSKISPFCRFVKNIKQQKQTQRLLCIHSNILVHLKFIGTNSAKRLKSYNPQRWICYWCYLKELPSFNTQNLSEETISITDQPYRTTFILKLWKWIETILVSHIWTPSPRVLHLMNSK